MSGTTASPPCSAARILTRSLELVEAEALKSFGRARTRKLMALFEELTARLPRCDLIAADVRSLRAAGQAMLKSGRTKEQMQLLEQGLMVLFDAARHLQLTTHHPIKDLRPAITGPMTSTLLVGLSPSLCEQVKIALSLTGVAAETESSPGVAAKMVRWYPFTRIIGWYPFAETGVETLLENARHIDSPSRRASLVLVTSEDNLEKAARYVGSGCNRVLTESLVPDLKAVFTALDNVAPRVPLKVPMVCTDAGIVSGQLSLWQIQNISATGILVRTRARIGIGTRFGCQFNLPGDHRALKLRAEVIRKTNEDRESFIGLGAQFVDVNHEARQRIDRFISSRLTG